MVQVLDPQWPRLCEAMGRPDLLERYPTSVQRVSVADQINDEVEAWMQTFPSDAALLAHLAEHRVPAAPVMDPADAVDHPWFRERGIVRDVDDEVLGRIAVTGLPLHLSGVPELTVDPPAPFLGQHNAEVLRECGVSEERIDALVRDGVLLAERH